MRSVDGTWPAIHYARFDIPWGCCADDKLKKDLHESARRHGLDQGISQNNPVMVAAWAMAPRALIGIGGLIHGAQLPGR